MGRIEKFSKFNRVGDVWDEYKGIAPYLNGQLRLLMKNIEEKNVSMAGSEFFLFRDADALY